jgi:MFS family permease
MAADVPAATLSPTVGSAERTHLNHAQMFAISSMWFALSVLWGSLLTVIIPIQVEDVLRRSGLTEGQVEAQKAGFLGIVVAVGAIAALVLPPIVGSISDRATHRMGRRRPYVIGGVAATVVGLFGMIAPPNLIVYSIFYLLVQIGSNTAVAAYQGLIPDMVPATQRGHASGWMGMMTILGNIVGLMLGIIALQRANANDYLSFGQQAFAYGAILAILVGFLAITYWGVRETPLPETPPPRTFIELLKDLWIDPKEHPDFAWVWFTRLLVTMGFNSVQFFLVYFLQDAVGIPRDKVQDYAGYAFLGLLLAGAIASIIGGRISDQRGRKPLIYLAGGVMSGAAMAFIAYMLLGNVALPGPFAIGGFNTVFYCGVAFGIGYGIYQSVDWALGTDVLPSGDAEAAKEMGVWHIALVLPQSLATLISGGLLTWTAGMGLPPNERYSLIFGIPILYFVLGTILVRNVRGAR